VRGHRERSLSPPDLAGNPLGGKGLFLFNVELRRSIWGHLGGSLFFDVGNVWEQPRRAQLEQLASAVGLELWFATPVGPIRLSHGFPITDELKPAKGRWHVAILFAY
jgi:outer membrane translocation and assembly module TamA